MVTTTSDSEILTQFLATRSPALREKLVLNSVSLVHYVLRRLNLTPELGSDYEDLVHQGLLGLIDAIDRYDPSHGTQFSTYATLRVRGKVLDYLRSMDWVSRTARHRIRSVQQAINDLYIKSQTTPTDEQIAAHLGLELPQVQQAMVDASRVIVSLDSLMDIDPESESTRHETLADDEQEDPSDLVAERDLKSRLVTCLKGLPEREQQVLSLYYFEELTFKEIGAILGVSESRICQLHARAILGLKSMVAYPSDDDDADDNPPRDGSRPAVARNVAPLHLKNPNSNGPPLAIPRTGATESSPAADTPAPRPATGHYRTSYYA